MDREDQLRRQKQFLIKFAYWAVWGITGILLLKFAGPVLLPFVMAFLVAWLLAHPIAYVSNKTNLKRNLVAIFFVAIFYALVVVLLYLLGSRVVGLIRGVSAEITAFLSGTIFPMVENFCIWIERIVGEGTQAGSAMREASGDSAGTLARAGQMVAGVSGTVIDGVSSIAVSIPRICMNILLTVIATMFIELDFPDILAFLRRQVPDRWRRGIGDIRTYTVGTLGKCLLSYVLILVMTFIELAAGFLILGIEGAFSIAFLVAVLDILPVFGTGMVLLPWMVIALASGNLVMGIGVLILYLIITVVRNIVEPKLIGQQMGLSPVVMLPCMIVGLKLFGIIGLFGVPFAVAFLKSLNDRGIIHIFKNL